MLQRITTPTLPVALGLSLALGLTGCSMSRHSQSQGHMATQASAPNHAPAHGLTGKFVYHYYPSCEVYFSPQRNVYFWRAAAYWGVGKRLPSTYRLDKREKVSVHLDTKMPYRSHNLVIARYPVGDPGKYASVDPNQN